MEDAEEKVNIATQIYDLVLHILPFYYKSKNAFLKFINCVCMCDPKPIKIYKNILSQEIDVFITWLRGQIVCGVKINKFFEIAFNIE